MKTFAILLISSLFLSGCVVRYTEPGAFYPGGGQVIAQPTAVEERCAPVSRLINGTFYFQTVCQYVEVAYPTYVDPGYSIYMGNRNKHNHNNYYKGGDHYKGDDH
ncbi:MAG: hypothetical protein ACD_56C00074G0001, partial [uncultured bacterium]